MGAGGIGRQEIADAAGSELRLAMVLPFGRRIEVHPDFDTDHDLWLATFRDAEGNVMEITVEVRH